MAKTTIFIGVPCRRMPPTLKHRPAIWEGILRTVYAMNEAGETKYFDYDHAAAKVHAGIANKQDIRLACNVRWSNGADYMSDPRVGELVLWVEESS